jgi:hypothetical protein
VESGTLVIRVLVDLVEILAGAGAVAVHILLVPLVLVVVVDSLLLAVLHKLVPLVPLPMFCL